MGRMGHMEHSHKGSDRGSGGRLDSGWKAGRPEAITRIEAAEAFASTMDRPVRRRHIPRAALRIGSLVLRRAKPELASSMAMGLAMDSADSTLGPQAFAELGIQPKSVRTYIAEVAPTLTGA